MPEAENTGSALRTVMRISSGDSVAGPLSTHWSNSSSVSAVASARFLPASVVARTAFDSRVPLHSGYGASRKNLRILSKPFSDSALCSAFCAPLILI